MNSSSIIHIAIAFDQNYLNQFFALICSILKNNIDEIIHVHSIATGLESEEIAKIRAYINFHNSEITFYSIDEHLVNKFIIANNWTHAVYYRLLFPFLIPENVKRLLYIDTDTLVLKNIGNLYNENLEDLPVGAVYDNYVKKQPLIGITEEGKYFNSGILLIDIPKWKNQQISEKAFEYLEKYSDNIIYVDQCALNAVLINNWKKLSEINNFMYSLIPDSVSKITMNKLLDNIVILHFTLERPWNYLCKNRFRYLYKYYLKLSGLSQMPAIVDFNIKKIPQFISIHLFEMYNDSVLLKRIRRTLKN